MAFDIACPQCEHHYVGIDPRLIGQSFTCACGAQVHVTEAAMQAHSPEADDAAQPTADQPEAQAPTEAQSPTPSHDLQPTRPAHITVVCPSCKHEFIGMDPGLAGQTFNCICGQQLQIDTVPLARGEAETDSPANATQSDATAPASQHDQPAAQPPAPHAQRAQAKHEAVATGMLQVVCPTCEHLYHSIPAEFAGRRFKCQTCDTRVLIPTKQDQAAAVAAKAKAAVQTPGESAGKLDYLSLATYEPEDEAVHNRRPDDYTPPALSAFDYEDADAEPQAAAHSNHLLIALILIAVLVLLVLVLSTYVVVMLAGGE